MYDNIHASLLKCLNELPHIDQTRKELLKSDKDVLNFLAGIQNNAINQYKEKKSKGFYSQKLDVIYSIYINSAVLDYILKNSNSLQSLNENDPLYKIIDNEFFADFFKYKLFENDDEKTSEDSIEEVQKNAYLFFKTIKKSSNILLENIAKYYHLEMDSFGSYESCIKDLCEYFYVVKSYNADYNNVFEYDLNGDKRDFQNNFINVLYRAISWSGDRTDFGYAFNGLKVLSENINYLDENLVINVLEKYESEGRPRESIGFKQVSNIISSYNSFTKSKAILKFYYIDRVIVENSLSIISSKYIYNNYKKYVNVFYRVGEPASSDESIEIIDLAVIRYRFRDNFGMDIEFIENAKKIKIYIFDNEENIKEERIIKNFSIDDYTCNYIKRSEFDDLSNKLIKSNFKFMISFLWVESYNNVIEKQGFNFENRNNFDFDDEKRVLKYQRISDAMPTNFFSEYISNIKAVIGKNGKGKTSILNFIKNELFKAISQGVSNYNFLAVIVFGNQHFYFSNLEGKISIAGDDYLKVQKLPDNFMLNDSKIVFFSNLINYNERYSHIEDNSSNYAIIKALNDIELTVKEATNDESFIIDISTSHIINNELRDNYSIKLNHDFFRQLAFLEFMINMLNKKSSSKNIKNIFDIALPRKITVKHLNLDEIKDYLNFHFYDVEAVRKFFDGDRIEKTDEIYNAYAYYNSLICDFEKICFLAAWIHILNKRDKGSKIDSHEIISFSSDIYSKCERLFLSRSGLSNINEIIIKHDISISVMIESLFLDSYLTLNLNFNFISFEFSDLSSGQLAKLITFSRLHWLFRGSKVFENWNKNDIIKSNPLKEIDILNNILLIIDEGETFFHPEWQRKYVFELIQFIELFLQDSPTKIKNTQIILASNSPFLISDFTLKNLILLGENNSDFTDKTFSQNIHILLANTFFMKDGLTGEFASRKIDWVIKKLNSDQQLEPKEMEIIKFILSNIGEPILANYLKAAFEEKCKSIEDLNKQNLLNNLKDSLKMEFDDEQKRLLKEYLDKANNSNITIDELRRLL